MDIIEINPHYPVLMSLDFNVSPCTAVITQLTHEGFFVINEIEAEGGINALIPKLRPYTQYNLKICGDNNGNARNPAAILTSYQIIQKELRVKPLPITQKANALHSFSQSLCNQLFFSLGSKFKISKKNCPNLFQGLSLAESKISESGRINLVKNDAVKWSHYVDCFRYAVNAEFKNTNDITNYAKRITGHTK